MPLRRLLQWLSRPRAPERPPRAELFRGKRLWYAVLPGGVVGTGPTALDALLDARRRARR